MNVCTSGECITIEQMKKWKEENNKQKLEEASSKADKCVFCKRVWMKFWECQEQKKERFLLNAQMI